MNVIAKRLLTFLIGVPAVIALVLFLPFYRHLPLNIVVILFTAVGAIELSMMLEKKLMNITKIEAFIIGALPPAAITLTVSFNLPEWIIRMMIMTGALWILMSVIFTRHDKIENAVKRLAGGFFILAYPGFFAYWLVKMSVWENSGAILIFLLIVMGSDSAAWLSGSLFGASNRGIIPVSPSKSIAGFAGQIAGGIIVSIGAVLIVPGIFYYNAQIASILTLICKALVLGVCTAAASALGDLAESAMKRSCGVKDSGKLMFGRGGILDSIDSIAFASPVYYVLFYLLFFTP
ncbi:MAG: phosphatidate cytidylyltransferase [Treponema sp.]|jgi:phosphatidate cytidylyltransferase|nr:phosphatidate cytidylyltransferase [Treponema sp.]